MLQNLLNLEGVKKMTKHQQSQLNGGRFNERSLVGNQASYKCCWEGTSNCSACVVTATPSCVSGAEAIQC